MTQSKQSHRGHAWQKIQAAERVTQEDGVEWLEVCLYCHADRRVAKSPNGRVRILSTQPDPLPEQCVRR